MILDAIKNWFQSDTEAHYARWISKPTQNISLDEIAGLDDVKSELMSIVNFRTDPMKPARLGVVQPLGWILIGAPGAGKRSLAHALANEAQVATFIVEADELLSPAVSGLSRIENLSKSAERHFSSIIIIENVESAGRFEYSETSVSGNEIEIALNQLASEVDKNVPRGSCTILAICGHSNFLSLEFLGSKYFREVYFNSPSETDRQEILKFYMRNVPFAPNADTRVLAEMSDGLQNSDLAEVVNHAAMVAAEREFRVITQEMLIQAIEHVKSAIATRVDWGQNAKGEAFGFRYFEVDENHKELMIDTLNGFSDYARLKGYSVNIALDGSILGKVGVKIKVIAPDSREPPPSVNDDIADFVDKIRNGNDFQDLPLVIDPFEHRRLVEALIARFEFLKFCVEQHRVQVLTYENFLDRLIPASDTLKKQIKIEVKGDMNMGDKFEVDRSPGAAVGRRNSVDIEASSIAVGSDNALQAERRDKIAELIGSIRASHISEEKKSNAVRHLENLNEEVGSSEKIDSGLVAKSLTRLKSVIETASGGADLIEKVNDLVGMFTKTN